MSFDEINDDTGKPSSFLFEYAHKSIGKWSQTQSTLHTLYIGMSIELSKDIKSHTVMTSRLVRQEMKYALRGGLSLEHQKLMIDCDAIMNIKIADRTPEQLELMNLRSAPMITLNKKFGILEEQMFPEECRALKNARAER
jgi:hypothetical protein